MRVYSAFEIAHLLRVGHTPRYYRADGDGKNAYAEFQHYVQTDLDEYRQAVTEVHAEKSQAVRTQGVQHGRTRG